MIQRRPLRIFIPRGAEGTAGSGLAGRRRDLCREVSDLEMRIERGFGTLKAVLQDPETLEIRPRNGAVDVLLIATVV